MERTSLNGSDWSKDSTLVAPFQSTWSSKLKNISITDGSMIKIKLSVVRLISNYWSSSQQMSRERFTVISYSRLSSTISKSSLISLKRAQTRMIRSELTIVSILGTMFSIKTLWLISLSLLSQESLLREKLFTLSLMKLTRFFSLSRASMTSVTKWTRLRNSS